MEPEKKQKGCTKKCQMAGPVDLRSELVSGVPIPRGNREAAAAKA